MISLEKTRLILKSNDMWPSCISSYLRQGGSVSKKTQERTLGQHFRRHGCEQAWVKESFGGLLFIGISLFPSSSMPLSFCYQIQRIIKATQFTKTQATSVSESSNTNTTFESSKSSPGSDHLANLEMAPFLLEWSWLYQLTSFKFPISIGRKMGGGAYL